MRPFTLKWFSKVLGTFLLLIPVHTAQADTGDLGLHEKLKTATASLPENLIRFDPVNPGDSTRPELKKADSKTRLKVQNQLGRMPLMFEENKGQTSDEVRFYSRGRGYNFYLTPTESVMVLSKTVREHPGPVKEPHRFDDRENMAPPKIEQSVVRMEVVGANEKATIKGEEKLQSASHYFMGNDQSKWRQGVAHYQKVHYEDVYDGIDLVYYGNQSKLEYDFIVKPGANPNAIRLQYDDIDHMSMEGGDLVIEKGFERIIQKAPKIYQVIDGKRITIEGNYIFTDIYEVGFYLGEYDTSQPLVIDPVLLFSTYLGGSDSDLISSVKTDSSGYIYIAGYTRSIDFPTVNPLDGGNVFSGGSDSFIAKIDPVKSTIWYSTYFGGSGDDNAFGLALDSLSKVYVTGSTDSTDFPTMNPIPGGETNSGYDDAFILKLNQMGDAIIYSTYLGGESGDIVYGIDVDDSGNAYITGDTGSMNFPILNPLPGGSSITQKVDIFVSKLNAMGNALVYSSYITGDSYDHSKAISVDSSGNAYVVGDTQSTNFPVENPIPGGEAQTSPGDVEAFVSKISAAGNSFIYSTYLGEDGGDGALAIAVDNTGSAYVTGYTRGNFPTVNAPQSEILSRGQDADIFVSKLSPGGGVLEFSFAFGGYRYEAAEGIALDDDKNIYLAGRT